MKVRAEIEPWENQLIEHKGKLDVARSESKLLKEKVGREKFSVEDSLYCNDIKISQKLNPMAFC